MNILIAADYATPGSGNFIGSMFDLGIELKKQNSNLLFIIPQNANTTSQSSWVHWLEKKGLKVFLINKNITPEEQLKILKGIIAEYKIDILHLHFGMFHHFAIYNRTELPVKIIIHEHMEYPVGCNRRKQTMRYLVRSLAYRVKRVYFISVNKNIHKAYFFAKRWYVPNAISFSRNVSSSMSRDMRRAQLGIKKDDKVVLLLGWSVHLKGVDIAVKAIQKCREKDPTIKLALLGMGDPPSQKRKDYIKESTNVSPDEPWIYYLPSTEDMFSYHKAVDVYLSASRSEAFSYGLLEAISQNTPVVVSNIKGTSWSSMYNSTFFYPTESYLECAEAIERAIIRGRSPRSNYQQVIDRYSIDKWIEKIIAIYKKI